MPLALWEMALARYASTYENFVVVCGESNVAILENLIIG